MKILLLGKNGQVGWELQRSLSPLGELQALDRNDLDLEDLDGLRRCLSANRPDIVVNAAAYTAVDKAESEPAKAYRINAEAVSILAEESRRLNAWLVHYSTDYVFDGKKSVPYEENDPVAPLSEYGKTKLAGEQFIRERHTRHLIFRTSWVYASRGNNFARTMLRLAREKNDLKVVADQYGAPTSAELIADVTALALFRIGRTANSEDLAGTYHLAASSETSWYGYAKYLLEQAEIVGAILRISAGEVQAITTDAYPLPARRPMNSRLNTEKLQNTFSLHLPHWQTGVARMVGEVLGGSEQ